MTAQSATDAVLLRTDRDGVAWLTLNRPQARNALSMGLMDALHAELTRIATDPDGEGGGASAAPGRRSARGTICGRCARNPGEPPMRRLSPPARA